MRRGWEARDLDAADTAALDLLLEAARWGHVGRDDGELVAVGDMESGLTVAREQSGWSCVWTERRAPRGASTFARARDAYRCVVMELGDVARTSSGMPSIRRRDAAPGTTLVEREGAWELVWDGGSARFSGRSGGVDGRRRATVYSILLAAAFTDIARSYLSPRGEPLFTARRT